MHYLQVKKMLLILFLCIAPLIVISIAGIAAMAVFPKIAHFILIPLVVNAAGSVGDLWIIRTGSKFLKGFVISFSVLVVLFGILPIALGSLGAVYKKFGYLPSF